MDFTLQPKQSIVFQSKANEILYGGGAGSGKAGDVNIPVPTVDGWKILKDIQVGDKVFGDDGQPCNVVAVTEIMYGRPCYEVTFNDGTAFIVDEQHQWWTYSYAERLKWIRHDPEWRARRRARRPSRAKCGDKFNWLKERNSTQEYVVKDRPLGSPKTTKEILDTLHVRGTRINHSVELCKAVQYSEKDLLIPPYVLGLWLGDGTANNGQFTTADQHNVDKIAEYYEINKQPSNAYGYGVLGLAVQLRELNLKNNKHIPVDYLTASESQRWELLQGLMDSDGYATQDGKLNFDNTNKAIIDGFMELVASLGLHATVGTKRATLYGKDCGIAYRVYFASSTPVFQLPRRLERQRLDVKPQYRRRQIVSVRPVDSIPVKCIEVDSHNHVFLWGKNYIPTHNSHLLRIAAIAYSVAIPGLQTYLFRRTSPDLLANHMSGPSGFPTILGEWVDQKHVTINYSKNEIRFWNGSTVHLCHCQHEKDKFSYQGAEIHLLLVDELTHFTESIYRYLRGRVRLGGLHVPPDYKEQFPRIICGTNPGNTGHMFVKKTWVDFAPAYEIQRAPPSEGGFKRQFVPALLSDNKVLMDNDPEYADRLRGLGTEALVEAMLKGSWDVAEGGYFDGVWDRDIHVIRPFDIPTSFRVDRSFDWGSSKPFSVGYWAESDGTEVTLFDGTVRAFPKGTLFRIGEIYGWSGEPDVGLNLTAAEIADKIIEYEASKDWGKYVRPGPADGSIYDKENGSCIADDMKDKKITWTRADKKPGSRIIGWLNISKRLKACKKFPMEDAGLFIFDTCQQFIRTVPTLPRDPSSSEDIYSKAEDHIGDETRYRCNYTVKTISTAPVVGL